MISLQIENLGALRRFGNKLDKLHSLDIKNGLAGKLAKAGANYAQQLYAGNATVTYEADKSGTAAVIASGHGILYREYGTGYVGEGTYSGNLPTRAFDFDSRGEHHTISGWVYAYWDKSHPNQALGGWYFNGVFTRGQPAGAQMWKTYTYLRDNKAQIVKEFLKAVNR